jgi:hypothetical protein
MSYSPAPLAGRQALVIDACQAIKAILSKNSPLTQKPANHQYQKDQQDGPN